MALVPEPTVVLYKSSTCRHCTALSNIWDISPNKGEESVTAALRKVNPKLRFAVITAKDNSGKFDENVAPKDLIRYGKWYPMILLIPGRIWDAAMSKLGPKNDAELLDGVQIMNGMWDKQELKYVQKYDIRKPSDFTAWVKESLDNEDFKRAQGGAGNGILVPTTSVPAQPIAPLLTSILRPNNTTANYVAAGHAEPSHTDICSMRIISRPR